MSILNDCDYVDITEFSGPDLLQDEEDIVEPQALAGQNNEFIEGQVRVRRGFKQAWNPNKVIATLYNWVTQQFNRLVYLNTTDATVVSRDLGSSVNTTILSSITAAGMSCIQAGFRLYFTFFSSTGTGVTQTKVWDGTFTSGTPNVESAFQPPLQIADVQGGATWGIFTEPNPGSMSAGSHNFALVGTTWNGFQQPPGPLNSGILAFATFVCAGSKNLSIQVSPQTTWPTYLNELQIAMTPVQNPARWFLVPGPGATLAVPRGSSSPLIFTIDISDITLVGGGPTEITDTLFNLYIQNPPTSPHCLVAYNNRNVYITRTLGPDGTSTVGTLLVSDPFKPQYVILAKNLLTLPEFHDTVTGFVVGSTLFILGPSWTYALSDNGQVPVLWAPPRLVSGTLGSPFIKGVTANPSTGVAWVCDHTGLYAFNSGIYPAVPASYLQTPDWDRINFAAPANALEVTEHSQTRLVMVKAPLDGATVATHILVWDYTSGYTPGKIKYCGLWEIGPMATAVSAPTYAFGAIAQVLNATTKIKEIWISRGDAPGNVKRLKSIEAGDATTANPAPLYDDDNVGIDSSYTMVCVSKAADGIHQQVGILARIRGLGQVNITAYSFDDLNPVALAPITDNSLSPGKRWLRLVDKQSEVAIFQFDNGKVSGSFFYLAALRAYYKPWMRER